MWYNKYLKYYITEISGGPSGSQCCTSACEWSKLDVLPETWELFCPPLSSSWAVIRGLFHPQDDPNRGRRSCGHIGRQLDGQHTERVRGCLLYSTRCLQTPRRRTAPTLFIIHDSGPFFSFPLFKVQNLFLLWKCFLWCVFFLSFFLY